VHLVEVWPQHDALLLIWVSPRENGDCFIGTGVIGHMRDTGGDGEIVASLQDQWVSNCSPYYMPRDPTLSAEILAQ
jgi:hypothetical protein